MNHLAGVEQSYSFNVPVAIPVHNPLMMRNRTTTVPLANASTQRPEIPALAAAYSAPPRLHLDRLEELDLLIYRNAKFSLR
jgi:hypothetical protein